MDSGWHSAGAQSNDGYYDDDNVGPNRLLSTPVFPGAAADELNFPTANKSSRNLFQKSFCINSNV